MKENKKFLGKLTKRLNSFFWKDYVHIHRVRIRVLPGALKQRKAADTTGDLLQIL